MSCPQVIVYRGSRGAQHTYNLKVTQKLYDNEHLQVALFKRRQGSKYPFFYVDYAAFNGHALTLKISDLSVAEAYAQARRDAASDLILNLIKSADAQIMPSRAAVFISSATREQMLLIQKERARRLGLSKPGREFSLTKALEEACHAWIENYTAKAQEP